MDPRVASVLAIRFQEPCEAFEKHTGAFKKELFLEENEEDPIDGWIDETRYDYEECDEDNGEFESNEINVDLLKGKPNIFDDSEDLDNIPYKTKQCNGIGHRRDGTAVYISKDKNTLWDIHTKQQVVARNGNSMQMGHVDKVARDATTAVDAWSLFINDEIITKITHHTNVVIEANKVNHTRERDCKPTTPSEIKAVFGLLYLAGAMRASHENLNDLYASDGLGLEYFTLVMSKSRLMFLMRAMRFDLKESRAKRSKRDKLAPIRDLFEIFVGNCRRNYVVSEFVTVDEMMEQFRGDCSFRLFMDNADKRGKYGVKVFAMACARTFYTCNMEVYVGKQPDGPYRVDNSARSIVKRMVEPISGSGRNVTIGNSFCSFALCAELFINHGLTVVGKLKNASGEIPPMFLRDKRPVGSSMFGYKQGCTLVSHKVDKRKHAVLLSSMHNSDATETDALSKNYKKPQILLFHEATKGSVATVDKYKKAYSVSRITRKWPMRVFFSMLDIAGLNSFIVLKENLNEPKMVHRTFLKSLGKSLCRCHMLSRLDIQSNPTCLRTRMRQILGVEEPLKPPPPAEKTRGRCYFCDSRKNRSSKTRCSQCGYFICKEHSSPRCVYCAQGDVKNRIDNVDFRPRKLAMQ